MTHTHHLTPKHAGGTDDESNLIRGVSLTRHAMFHFARWQLEQDKYDFIAWKTLAGQLKNEEFDFQMRSAAGKRGSAVTNSRYPEEKKIWSAKAGKNQPHEVKVVNGKKLVDWRKNNPKEWAEARNRASTSCKKPVRITNIASGESFIFDSVKAAAEFIGCAANNVSKVASGKQNQVKGFKAEKI